jgi:hypothetical protein
MNEWNAVLVLSWSKYAMQRGIPVSRFKNVIAFLFQHDAIEILISGFLLLFLYLFASQFSRNHHHRRQAHHHRRQAQSEKAKTTLTPDSL